MPFKNTPEIFWTHVDRSGGTNACWPWTQSLDMGYGQLSWHGEHSRAHVVAYELTTGPVPKGMCVCHNCPGGDNRACCNPAHFFLGTTADNTKDTIKKGRGVNPPYKTGENNGHSKLTWDKVREIRRLYAVGNTSSSKIAKQFGINQSHVWQIVTNKQWRE